MPRAARAAAEIQRRLRIEWAAEALLEEGASLAQIAARAGFADEIHYNRTFVGHFGVPPGARARRVGGRASLSPLSTTGNRMSAEENKALVRRYIETIDNNDSSDWSILDEFIAEDVAVHNPQLPWLTPDREGMKQAAETFRQATPGRHEIPLQVAEGDLVVSLVVGRGTHEGELLGIPASGKPVETEGIAIHRIAAGKIAEYRGVTDTVHVLQQVGAVPPPAGLGTGVGKRASVQRKVVRSLAGPAW